MKFTATQFHGDHLQLTRWELILLFFGFRVKKSPLTVTIKPATKKDLFE